MFCFFLLQFLLFFLLIRRPPRPTLFPYTSSSDLAVPAGGRRRLAIPLASAASRSGGAPAHSGGPGGLGDDRNEPARRDRKSTRLNSSHSSISYAVFCLKKKKKKQKQKSRS